MPDSRTFSLYFLGANPFFPEGTLFELVDPDAGTLPDGGDGSPGLVDVGCLTSCPPFAENVPPGQCPVRITSFDLSPGELGQVIVDQTPHWQVIVIPLPPGDVTLLSASVSDRLRDLVTDEFENPSPDILDGRTVYRLHIGWLRPGFYAAELRFSDGTAGRLTFIKFFPPQFASRYSEIAAGSAQSPAVGVLDVPERKAYRSDGEFSDELLNLALELTTEWGENYGKPIDGRITAIYPELSADEITRLTAIARETESLIYALAEQELEGRISENDIVPAAMKRVPWLNDSNAARLKSIGMFYARK